MTQADADLLIGYKAIGRYLGMTPRQVEYHANAGHLPTFPMGGLKCARRSSLLRWIEEQERKQAGGG